MVVFHVADWQPTASEQLRQYEEILPQIRLLNARIVAISPDSVWSHRAFAESLGLSFPLLSDDAPWGATAATYRVHPDAQDRRRAVFVIDHEGVIRWAGVYPDAINPGVDGVLSALEGMRAAAA